MPWVTRYMIDLNPDGDEIVSSGLELVRLDIYRILLAVD